MVQYFDEIPPSLAKWIDKQQVFWVATAPLSGDGHVNVSPKGGDGMFHIVNERQVWYEDLTGSGVETISHLRENGRITVLFNAFEGPPRIARLYGRGTVYEFGTPEFDTYISPESRKPGTRSIIVVDVFKVGTSCGYSVPFFDFKSHRTRLLTWATNKERLDQQHDESGKPDGGLVDGLRRYWNTKNMRSLDGLPGLAVAPYTEQKFSKRDVNFKPDDESERTQYAKIFRGASFVNILVGFTMGVAMTSVYVRMARSS
ncbi:Pyridoxamine phosphate oxidase [Mycena indigotica]|uniref:Pyridoxamine phosphate oxidase n=1 Tax=Mycena indigotica TaxID=2126181 RepID=A0A8H6SRC6_9AGAR|nr:Pyridoxamine phosphate oxidase [Mycena indigotica]KAF7303630.1 Pyridoxamine phosphate oxidase [Mycena indigotica]